MAYKSIFIDEDAIIKAVSALRENAILKREMAKDKPEEKELLDQVREIESAATEFERALRSGERQPKPPEEFSAIDEFLKNVQDELAAHYPGETRVGKLKAVFAKIKDEKSRTDRIFATLLEDTKTRLKAIEFLAQGALNGGTHRIKNNRLHALLEAINATLYDISGIDSENPWKYEYYGTSDTWDFRKMAVEIRHLKSKLERLKNGETEFEDAF